MSRLSTPESSSARRRARTWCWTASRCGATGPSLSPIPTITGVRSRMRVSLPIPGRNPSYVCLRGKPHLGQARASEPGAVGLQPLHELLRATERRQVSAVDLVGGDAEPLPHHPAQELGREEAVVPAQKEPRRHVRPRLQRPRLGHRRARLVPFAPRERLCDHIRRYVVEEVRHHVEVLDRPAVPLEQLAPGLLPAGRGPAPATGGPPGANTTSPTPRRGSTRRWSSRDVTSPDHQSHRCRSPASTSYTTTTSTSSSIASKSWPFLV